MKIDSKRPVALITGGSSGMGYEFACQLGAKKYDLVLVARNAAKLEQAVDKLKLLFDVNIYSIALDLSLEDSAETLFEYCQTNDIGVDVLVNNAGVLPFGRFVDMEISRIKGLYALHVYTTTKLCRLFAAEMVSKGRKGDIIVMASLSAYTPYPTLGLYAASKSYLKHFAGALRLELIDYGINVTCACPGWVKTDMITGIPLADLCVRMGIGLSAKEVVSSVLKATYRKRGLVIPNVAYKLMAFLSPLIPKWVIRLIYNSNSSSTSVVGSEDIKKVALVTGASSGIGYSFACKLAEQGYKLIIVSNEADKIIKAGKEIATKYGVEVKSLYADLAKFDAAERLFDECKNMGVSVVVNNAGMFLFNKFTDVSVSKIEAMLNLQVLTPTIMSRLFSQQMMANGGGYILNMSSLSAWMEYPGLTMYSSTKRYLKNFTTAMHNEMSRENVVYTSVCPGAVATDLYNLSDRYKKLGLSLGILMTSAKLTNIALKGLFNKRAVCIPGAMNWLFIPISKLIPNCTIIKLKRLLFRKLLDK